MDSIGDDHYHSSSTLCVERGRHKHAHNIKLWGLELGNETIVMMLYRVLLSHDLYTRDDFIVFLKSEWTRRSLFKLCNTLNLILLDWNRWSRRKRIQKAKEL